MTASAMQIHAPWALLMAAVPGLFAMVLLWRADLPRLTRWLLAVSIVLVVAAAGDPHGVLPTRGDVVVLVDLSPSTRSAAYRDRAALDARLKQLLGSRRYQIRAFAESESALPSEAKLPDLPAVQTNFTPPKADAIVLLSDGRFELPASGGPVYAVIDPGLVDPLDAAIDDVRVDESAADVFVTGRGQPRVLSLTSSPPLAVSPSHTTVHRVPLPAPPPIGRAELNKGDIWPENDALSFAPPQPAQRQRWWISDSAAPEGWVAISPEAVATRPEELLAPSVIALDNLPADSLPPATHERLQQYVRDLGGGLLILGGDRAFGVGGYTGTTLDALSPLASDPPTPTTHWLLLTDASGSMATGERWAAASTALTTVVRELPGADLVSVGSFAADLTWWANVVKVEEARQKPLPPAGVGPSGPTNLQPVMQKLVDTASGDLPRELLLLTDGETTVDNAMELANVMRARKVRLHVLAIGTGPALAALRSIADATGGSYAAELDARQWLAGARKLLRASRGDRTIERAGSVDFLPPMQLNSREVTAANRTWLRRDATPLAQSDAGPMAAVWQVGNGRVAAAAFDVQAGEREALAKQVARPPRDPRFRVDWHGPGGRVIVDAADDGKPLNGLNLDLSFRPLRGEGMNVAFAQSAPGRYELLAPPSPQPRLAVLRLNGREVDRRTLPGRYAREFSGIGTDEANLRELARRTGGRVIGPAETGPILPTLWRDTALAPWLCGLAALLMGGALIHWKRT